MENADGVKRKVEWKSADIFTKVYLIFNLICRETDLIWIGGDRGGTAMLKCVCVKKKVNVWNAEMGVEMWSGRKCGIDGSGKGMDVREMWKLERYGRVELLKMLK